MSARPADHDFFAWVERLAIRHHHRDAMWHLVLSGPPALDAVRAGLAHDDREVRLGCAEVLDHLVDEEAWPDLLSMMDDEDAGVRHATLHALACDRCKADGSCAPTKSAAVPIAMGVLRGDPEPLVRNAAIGVLARWVHEDAEVLAAISAAREADPDSGVRKTASWWVPGGPRYEKTKPKVRRRRAS